MKKESNEQRSNEVWSSLSKSDAISVLSIAIEGSRRPIDRVIDQLVEDDENNHWLNETRARTQSCGMPYRAVLDGSASIESLTELKNWCKVQVATMHNTPQRDQFTFLYFIALAASLAHHATLISNRRPEEIIDALEMLMPVLPAEEHTLVDLAMKQARILRERRHSSRA